MKHTPAQLQAMAREALAARDSGDHRWDVLVLNFMLKTQWTPRQVVAGIEALARGETPQ